MRHFTLRIELHDDSQHVDTAKHNFKTLLLNNPHKVLSNKHSTIHRLYNGWLNWDTWNLNLHITNDYNSYQNYMEFIDLLIMESTRFGDTIDLTNVDFNEIIQHEIHERILQETYTVPKEDNT